LMILKKRNRRNAPGRSSGNRYTYAAVSRYFNTGYCPLPSGQ